jgi:hypothetical protein
MDSARQVWTGEVIRAIDDSLVCIRGAVKQELMELDGGGRSGPGIAISPAWQDRCVSEL